MSGVSVSRTHAAIASFVVIAVTLAIGVWQVRPPAPAGERAPADEFSAARAIAHIETLAAEPRPIGSAAHARARRYLVGALRDAGLEASLQSATVFGDGDRQVLGSVDNVVGLLPGRDRSLPVVVLMAHYDSVAASRGAADDASGVAVVLETARALAADADRDGGRGRLPADVEVVFTDGEENRLFGARAFLQAAGAPRAGVVLNFDNAGPSGPSVMYQTSEGNARLVDVLAQTTRPLGSSLIDELARRERVPSDFTPLREAGLPIMTFGLSEGFVRNHTRFDTVERIVPGSIQHQGDQALSAVRAAAREIAAGRLTTDGEPDVVYFPVSRSTLVVYGRDWVVPLALVAVGLYLAVLVFGLARRGLDGFSFLSGVVNSLLTLIFMAAVTAALWGFGWAGAEGGDASNPPYASDLLHRGGLTLILVAVGLALYLWGLDREHVVEATLGAALWWLVAVLYVGFALPGGSYLFIWPLLALLVSLALVLIGRWPSPDAERQALPSLVILWLGVLPALLLFGSSIYLLFTVSEMRLAVVLLSTWLLLGALLPELALLRRRARRVVPVVAGVIGLAIVVGLSPVTGLADDPTRPPQVFYWHDAATGVGNWGGFASSSDNATLSALVWNETGAGGTEAPALPAPRIEVVSDRRDGDRRTVELHVMPTKSAQPVALSLFVESDVGPLQATVAGLALTGSDTHWLDASASHWHVDWYAPRPDGLTIGLTIDAGRPLALRIAQLDRGLPDAPALRAPARPDGSGEPGVADATVVQTTFVLGRRVGARLVERAVSTSE
jgi:hypothetical protein